MDKRLRQHAEEEDCGCTSSGKLLCQAADLIEELEQELANAKALQSHSNHIVKLKKELDEFHGKRQTND